MTAPTEPRVVEEFGTGLLHTVVLATPEGFRWRRTPGPLAPQPFHPVDRELTARLAALGPADRTRLVLGVPEDGTRRYDVRGSVSVAKQLLRDGASPELVPALRGLGSLLRAVHDTEPTATTEPRARGLNRLEDWVTDRARTAKAAAGASQLRSLLGEDRWRTVRAWCVELAEDSDVVLAHGMPGLGSVVVGSEAGTADVLTGEDLCLAPWYFDLGWVVGELVELKWHLAGPDAAWQQLIDALFSGYGRDLGPDWARPAALRIVLHLHDYTAYVGLDPAALARYAAFLGYLIDLC